MLHVAPNPFNLTILEVIRTSFVGEYALSLLFHVPGTKIHVGSYELLIDPRFCDQVTNFRRRSSKGIRPDLQNVARPNHKFPDPRCLWSNMEISACSTISSDSLIWSANHSTILMPFLDDTLTPDVSNPSFLFDTLHLRTSS
jgi:hypothetical protein